VAVAANLQQARNGNLVLGSSRQFVGFDGSVDSNVVAQVLSRCLRFFPVLSAVTAIRTWSGFRPYTPDLLPIISPVDSLAGLYIAAGHEGIGITEAPITGKLISQLITGEQPELPLDQLAYARFLQ
jgi:sarcosine oxidase subunit beta